MQPLGAATSRATPGASTPWSRSPRYRQRRTLGRRLLERKLADGFTARDVVARVGPGSGPRCRPRPRSRRWKSSAGWSAPHRRPAAAGPTTQCYINPLIFGAHHDRLDGASQSRTQPTKCRLSRPKPTKAILSVSSVPLAADSEIGDLVSSVSSVVIGPVVSEGYASANPSWRRERHQVVQAGQIRGRRHALPALQAVANRFQSHR